MNLASSWCWKPEAVLTQTQMPVTSTRVRLTDQQTSMVVKPDKRVRLGVRALGEFGWMWSILIRTEIRLGCLISNAWTALWLVIAQIWKLNYSSTEVHGSSMNLWLSNLLKVRSQGESSRCPWYPGKKDQQVGTGTIHAQKWVSHDFMSNSRWSHRSSESIEIYNVEVGDGWHLDIFWT